MIYNKNDMTNGKYKKKQNEKRQKMFEILMVNKIIKYLLIIYLKI